MQSAEESVHQLLRLVDVEPLEVDLFRGPTTHEAWTRVFGGQVIAQALMAACRTVEESRPAHSLHAYFMRPGNPHIPIVYQVSRDRDGGSFSSRRVVAIQDGKPILNLAASFHIREEGRSHRAPMPDAPPPETLQNEVELFRSFADKLPPQRRDFLLRPRPIEFRPVNQESRISGKPQEPRQMSWLRAAAPLPDDPTLHRVLLAYASDMMLLSTSMRPHGFHWFRGEVQDASLDHALWIHEDVRVDEWLLYVMESPWSGGARGMNFASIYTRDGRLVASVAQEGLIRPIVRQDGRG